MRAFYSSKRFHGVYRSAPLMPTFYTKERYKYRNNSKRRCITFLEDYTYNQHTPIR